MNSDLDFWSALVEYTFLQRALLASIAVGAVCGLVGSFIILRGLSLMGDAISHAVLPGVAISYIAGINLFFGAVGTGLLTAMGISYVHQKSKLKSDTAIGIVFSAAFALGIILITEARASSNLHNVLFGNVLAITRGDMLLTLGVGAAVIIIMELFHKQLLVTSFDPAIAGTYGISATRMHYLLMVALTCVTVAALQTVGIVLVVAMLITPAATAYLLTHRLRPMILVAMTIGVISAIAGLYLSYRHNLPSGPSIVLILAGTFLLAFLFSPRQGRVINFITDRRNRKDPQPA